ncbi:recombination protein NinB [Aliamphritea hakodatensis]|uniref:recombination protein NinB n=1 Tax=Aliamphritea hakodatensis TaxID=2895352 RepID=UPI0022FD4BB8|nr:recombination protein NinB [Aliamphritea hakodatensis]
MSKGDLQILIENETVKRDRMMHVWKLVNKGLTAGPVLLTLGREKRTLDQNAKMWAMLADVSFQVDWYGEKLCTESWKNIFTASLFKQKTVPGIDGGFVVLGKPTRNMKKRTFAELIELMYAFGAEHGVHWSERNVTMIQEYLQWLNDERAKEGDKAA